jgi:hypothetical protein
MNLIAGIKILNNIYSAISETKNPENMDEVKKNINTAMVNSKSDIKNLKFDGNMIKILKKFIIEPMIIIDKDLKNLDNIHKILHLHTDIFAGYFVQVFKILHNIYGINQDMILELLSTNSKYSDIDVGKKLYSDYSKESKLDKLLNNDGLLSDINISLENKKDKEKEDPKLNLGVDPKATEGDSKLENTTLYNMFNRTYEIKFTKDYIANGKTTNLGTSMNITIKPNIIFTDIKNILTLFEPYGQDKNIVDRWHEYKSGGIEFFKDFVLCNDLIKNYKKSKLNDKDDILKIINSRKLSSLRKQYITDKKGYETNYTMLLVSSENKKYLDNHIKGDVSKEKYKQILLEQISALTLTVIDQDYEMFYTLTKDLRSRSEVTFKQLNKRKEDNLDLSELVKAMMNNKPPVF